MIVSYYEYALMSIYSMCIEILPAHVLGIYLKKTDLVCCVAIKKLFFTSYKAKQIYDQDVLNKCIWARKQERMFELPWTKNAKQRTKL